MPLNRAFSFQATLSLNLDLLVAKAWPVGYRFAPEEYNVLWDVRKGLVQIVGAARTPGMLQLAVAAQDMW